MAWSIWCPLSDAFSFVVINIVLNDIGPRLSSRDAHGNGIPMVMGLKHGIGNGKPPQWEWELPALPWEFIPTDFCAAFSILSY